MANSELENQSPRTAHRRIAATFFMTLDGVVQDPQNWSFPYWDDETQKFKEAELVKTDALLLGRTTYEGFAAAWPARKGADWFSTKFNTMPKYVVSDTLQKAEWENSTIIRRVDAEREIKKLTGEGQGDLGVHGSVSLTRWLVQHDMIDELRILVYPLVLGVGLRLFDGVPKTKLQLVESKPFSKGVVSMVYARARQE